MKLCHINCNCPVFVDSVIVEKLIIDDVLLCFNFFSGFRAVLIIQL